MLTADERAELAGRPSRRRDADQWAVTRTHTDYPLLATRTAQGQLSLDPRRSLSSLRSDLRRRQGNRSLASWDGRQIHPSSVSSASGLVSRSIHSAMVSSRTSLHERPSLIWSVG